jgi:plasmid stabilization system protein ParE
MTRYYLSPLAIEDMNAIDEYYADRSPAYGYRLLQALVIKFKLVGRFPRLGNPVKK